MIMMMPVSYAPLQGRLHHKDKGWLVQMPGPGALLANAEAGKNPPQQVIRGEFAGDFGESVLRQAQVFGQQLTGPVLLQLHTALVKKLAGTAYRVKVAAAGDKAARVRGLKAHMLL